MVKLEREKGSESPVQLVEHMKQEARKEFLRMRARNRQLKAEAEDRPGAEIYFPGLEGIADDIERVEKKV